MTNAGPEYPPPRIGCRPDWVSSTGPEAVDLAASAGLILDRWQAHTVDVFLAERSDGRWAALECGLCVPRQNGKGAVLEAIELVGLFLLGEKLILHTAHEFKTAAEAFLRIRGLIENCDALRSRVLKFRTSHGEESVDLRSGARLRFIARSRSSGRGFTADRIILDEAFNLGPAAMAAILPTVSAIDNPQLIFTSTAGDANAVVFAAMRARASGDPDDRGRLAWLEWSAEETSDQGDPAVWAGANPGMPHRITEEFVAAERAAMGAAPAEFARERLGIWHVDAAAEEPGDVDGDAWAAAQDPRSRIPDDAGVFFAVDCSPGAKSTAIVVAGLRPDGRTHIEVVEHRPGLGWAVSKLRALCEQWSTDVILDPRGPANALLTGLRREGAPVRELRGGDFGAACAGFESALTEGRVAVRPDDGLSVAAGVIVKRPFGDGFAWRRKDCRADPAPFVAAALGWWVAQQPAEVDLVGQVW